MGINFGSIASSILRPVAQAAAREVSASAVGALHQVAAGSLDQMVNGVSSGAQGALRQLPIIGSPLADMVGYATPAANYALQQQLAGGMDQLYSRMFGMPTARPVLGADGSYTLPSLSDQYRLDQMMSSIMPYSSTYASTAVGSNYYGGSSGTVNGQVSGRTPSGGFPPYPQPPADPTDLGAMKKYQDDMLRYNAAKDALQNDFGLRNAMQTSHKSMMQQLIQSLGR